MHRHLHRPHAYSHALQSICSSELHGDVVWQILKWTLGQPLGVSGQPVQGPGADAVDGAQLGRVRPQCSRDAGAPGVLPAHLLGVRSTSIRVVDTGLPRSSWRRSELAHTLMLITIAMQRCTANIDIFAIRPLSESPGAPDTQSQPDGCRIRAATLLCTRPSPRGFGRRF